MGMVDGLRGTLAVVELVSHDGLLGALGFLLVGSIYVLLRRSGSRLLRQLILGILFGGGLSARLITALVQQVSTFQSQAVSFTRRRLPFIFKVDNQVVDVNLGFVGPLLVIVASDILRSVRVVCVEDASEFLVEFLFLKGELVRWFEECLSLDNRGE